MRPFSFGAVMNEFTEMFDQVVDDLMETFGDEIVYHPEGGFAVAVDRYGKPLKGEFRQGGHDVTDGDSDVRILTKSLAVCEDHLPDGVYFNLGSRVTVNDTIYTLSDELDRTDNLVRYNLQVVVS
jgi:hypothetical protein